jgi:aminoglycoside phosphotransferase
VGRRARLFNFGDGSQKRAHSPCESQSKFNDHLFSSASNHSFETRDEFEEKVAVAKRLQPMRHPVVFTHGDFKHHNIMVHNGHVSGFLDRESAGWYPDYWEFTTPLRFGPKDFWWIALVLRLGGSKYLAEFESETWFPLQLMLGRGS